jgi:hypothetical protein
LALGEILGCTVTAEPQNRLASHNESTSGDLPVQ